MSIEDLTTLVNELRPAAVMAVAPREAADPRTALDRFVVSLGYRPLGANWQLIDKDQAEKLLRCVLENDMAYNNAEMTPAQAAAITADFLNLAGAAVYFTNGEFNAGGWSGYRLSPAVLDAGVVWVNADQVGILWVEDED